MPEITDHDMIVQMHQILCGNGHKGLCQEFEDHRKEDKDFRKEYYTFKRWAIGIVCFLVGTGLISIGIIKGI